MILRLFPIALLLFTFSCKRKNIPVENCLPGNDYKNRVVFVGKKISLETSASDDMDAKFSARYKILELLCGNYGRDTIDFIVYDHYGIPAFSKYETVMLFVTKYNDTFYHDKYNFFDLYKTKDGQWASPSSWKVHDSTLKPHQINFSNEISFDVSHFKKQRIKQLFPVPYYQIKDGKAIAEYGNYLSELFEAKKRQYIRSMSDHGNSDNIKVIDTEFAEIAEPEVFGPSTKGYKEFSRNWNDFLFAIKMNNSQKLRELSIDSVYCSVCEGFSESHYFNDKEPIDSFIAAAYRNFPPSHTWKIISSKNYLSELYTYNDSTSKYSGSEKRNKLIIYTLKFADSFKENGLVYPLSHKFSFIKINGYFKFYGMETY
ncbi:MAG: hypothetical protein QM687_07635 [Ferruginibacter sp.]